jgi:arylsulfatase A-like enzyme
VATTDTGANSLGGATTERAPAESRAFFDASRWISSARFLVAWIFPAALAIYLKWYLMTEQEGFTRVAQSMGLRTLSVFDKLAFFRGEILVGFFAVPGVLLVVNRFGRPAIAAAVTAVASLAATVVLGAQILSLKELGRYSSVKMLEVAASWGRHEPGSSVKYLLSGQALLIVGALVGIVIGAVWAARSARHPASDRTLAATKTAIEVVLFFAVAAVLLSLRSELPGSPYNENSYTRAASSLWNESTVESATDDALNLHRNSGLETADLSSLSSSELIDRYRALAHTPTSDTDAQYFGKAAGANILFIVLETTPEKYLPAGADMKQLPNFNALQHDAFVGTRHYTTFPITRSAIFSVFSGWYPIDDPSSAFESPRWDSTDGFLKRLGANGYKTAVFSPLKEAGIPDAALYNAVGFAQQFYPDSAVADYDKSPSWQKQRVQADVDTLHLLETQIDRWTKHGDKFVAAFLPQIAHWPYPDDGQGESAADLQRRGQAILAQEDAWVGELMAELQRDGAAKNTIVVVLGDHGLRALTENPNMRRGTIDETAFHVPLIVHAPQALDHTENISWLTSHVDIVPTLLDLLGVKDGRESEQGTAIWNPALAQRTTFFFAKPMFGADGYTEGGNEFFMWHYFSGTVYEKTSAEFDPSDIVPRRSPVAETVTSQITSMVALEKAWHKKFSAAAGVLAGSNASAKTSVGK